jgi:hypothetical protein
VNKNNSQFKELFPELLERSTAEGGNVDVADGLQSKMSAVTGSSDMPEQQDANTSEASNTAAAADGVIPSYDQSTDVGSNGLQPELVPTEIVLDTADDTGSDGEPIECWVCRDTDSPEPLIQPCACRGSMSGVHASCVEQWINRHRRDAVHAEAPRCSVCHQEYRGYEWQPGVREFARSQCYDCGRQTCVTGLRSVVLVALLTCLQEAADTKIPLAVRVLFIVGVALVSLHKVLILTISLPPHQAPPEHRFAKLFFVGDPQRLAIHMAEGAAAVTMLLFFCLLRALPLALGLPFAALGLIPVAKVLIHRHPNLDGACFRQACTGLLALIFSPFLITWALLLMLRRYPQRVLHPLGAGLHIIVALTAVPLCLFCESNVPVIILWAVHSFFVAVGLLEMLLVKRFAWKEDLLWLISAQITALAMYLANTLCVFPKGIGSGSKEGTRLVVLGVSTLWLLLVLGLALSVNRALLLGYFRTWQHRHGTFRLQGGSGPTGNLVAPEDAV